MKEPHGEGLASHTDPESCVVSREAGHEALQHPAAYQSDSQLTPKIGGQVVLAVTMDGPQRRSRGCSVSRRSVLCRRRFATFRIR
jgi:hypothetical protein